MGGGVVEMRPEAEMSEEGQQGPAGNRSQSWREGPPP